MGSPHGFIKRGVDRKFYKSHKDLLFLKFTKSHGTLANFSNFGHCFFVSFSLISQIKFFSNGMDHDIRIH